MIQNLFIVLAIAFVMHLLLFFVRGQKGDDISAVVTGVIFFSYTTFKVLVFKRDNPGKQVTMNFLCGFDALQERAMRTQKKVAASTNQEKETGNKKKE